MNVLKNLEMAGRVSVLAMDVKYKENKKNGELVLIVTYLYFKKNGAIVFNYIDI